MTLGRPHHFPALDTKTLTNFPQHKGTNFQLPHGRVGVGHQKGKSEHFSAMDNYCMTKAFGGVQRAEKMKNLKTNFSESLELFDKLHRTAKSDQNVIMSKADIERMEKTKLEFESQKNLIPTYQ
jgi:hypothetical protein